MIGSIESSFFEKGGKKKKILFNVKQHETVWNEGYNHFLYLVHKSSSLGLESGIDPFQGLAVKRTTIKHAWVIAGNEMYFLQALKKRRK